MLVVPSASVADAVISAEAPLEASSAKVLASESVSDARSHVELVSVCNRHGERGVRCRTVRARRPDGDGAAGRGLVVDRAGVCDGDGAGGGSDGECARAGLRRDGVGHRVGGAVRIGCKRGDFCGGAIGYGLGQGVGVGVAVGYRTYVELIHVCDSDGEGLCRYVPAGICGGDGKRAWV